MTPDQIMLIGLLTDKLITIGTTLQKVGTMTEEQVQAEISKIDKERKDATDRIRERQR